MNKKNKIIVPNSNKNFQKNQSSFNKNTKNFSKLAQKTFSKNKISEIRDIRKLLKKGISIISPHNIGEKALFCTLADLKKEYNINPLYTYKSALNRLTPGLRLEPNIKGGKVMYYPADLPITSSYYYAIKWLLSATTARDKKLKLHEKLSLEINDTFVNRGAAYKSKMDFFKSILESRVYAPVPSFDEEHASDDQS